MEVSKEKRKPRLLVATDNFLPRWDGVARFLSEVIPRLAGEFDIVVVAPDFGPVENFPAHLVKIPIHRREVGDFHLARVRYRVVRREARRCDIVFSQTIGPIGACAIIAGKAAGKPVVSFVHSIESRLVPMAVAPGFARRLLLPLMHAWTRFLYNKASLLITPSEWVDDHLAWEGVRARKCVVRLGVDTHKFSPGAAKELRKSLGIADDEVVVGQHGRLAREKDLRTLLRAFVRLQTRHKKVRLLVVADGLRSVKRMLDDREGVIVTGRQDDVVPYLRAMDIFALTSLTETTCLAALEAMSCGLPVVSTPVGFVRDYVEEGKNGFFFPTKDAYALATRLSWLARHPVERHEMGQAARKLVVEEFSWERTVEGIRAALQEAVDWTA